MFIEQEFNEIDAIQNRLNLINESNHKKTDQYERYTSKKGCTLYEFISMLQKVTERTIGQSRKIEFVPEEGKIPIKSFSMQLDSSYVVYRLISRKPSNELNYRFREEVIEYDEVGNKQRSGEVLGQKQEILIQFDFFSPTVAEVEEVMNKFEDNMILYKGYFMKNGVGKIIFKEQLTDSKLEDFRQSTSVRSLIYYVELEKLIEKFDEDIISIDAINK